MVRITVVEVVMPEEEKEKKLSQKEVKEILASLEGEIRELAKIGKVLEDSNLTRRTILLILRDATGLGMRSIEDVLDALATLDRAYLKTKV